MTGLSSIDYVDDMRDWLQDVWGEDTRLDSLSATEVLDLVSRNYVGGVSQFITDTGMPKAFRSPPEVLQEAPKPFMGLSPHDSMQLDNEPTEVRGLLAISLKRL